MRQARNGNGKSGTNSRHSNGSGKVKSLFEAQANEHSLPHYDTTWKSVWRQRQRLSSDDVRLLLSAGISDELRAIQRSILPEMHLLPTAGTTRRAMA